MHVKYVLCVCVLHVALSPNALMRELEIKLAGPPKYMRNVGAGYNRKEDKAILSRQGV